MCVSTVDLYGGGAGIDDYDDYDDDGRNNAGAIMAGISGAALCLIIISALVTIIIM